MEPTSTIEPPVYVEPPKPEPRGLAPVWHTVLLILLFVALTVGGTKRAGAAEGHAKWPLYVETIAMQWVLVLYTWWGLRMHKRTLREVIGGRWDNADAVMTDVLIAIGFFFANLFLRALVLAGLMFHYQ